MSRARAQIQTLLQFGGQPSRDQLCHFCMTGLPQRVSATDMATGTYIPTIMEVFFELTIITFFLQPLMNFYTILTFFKYTALWH